MDLKRVIVLLSLIAATTISFSIFFLVKYAKHYEEIKNPYNTEWVMKDNKPSLYITLEIKSSNSCFGALNTDTHIIKNVMDVYVLEKNQNVCLFDGNVDTYHSVIPITEKTTKIRVKDKLGKTLETLIVPKDANEFTYMSY
ncbi:hypothetical protein [Bacillus thuringiensis]|uniref:hypothetical protein n=1 Tax=Bacillus thuringiensis TaxID=1428 RepID=UPI0021D68953|nr:hypothetical protein [Bacillus thuringiensis]MCU7667711.1 hypothetical protein [Bacillus thuringiensis]